MFMRGSSRSQNGRTTPRSVSSARSASMAVYVGRIASSPARPGELDAPIECLLEILDDLEALLGQALRRRSATRAPRHGRRETTTRSACSSRGSKSTSQIQETSRPSAIASLSATTSVRGHAAVLERAQRLVRAGGVLDEQDDRAATVELDPLEATEGRPHPLEPGDDRRRVAARSVSPTAAAASAL